MSRILDGVDLAQKLGDFAVSVQNLREQESVLELIVSSAVGIIPGARWAGISVIQGRAIEPRVPSAHLVTEIDGLQSELGEGPCISALREHRTVHIDDMSEQSPWPDFAEAALARGVKSSLSFQLYVVSDNLGALNLYADEPGAFDEDSFLYGEILAQHASVAMAGSKAEDQFGKALASRDTIGQAKGILMERFGVDDVRAFAMLTKLSQDGNTKLFDIARRVIATRNQGEDRNYTL